SRRPRRDEDHEEGHEDEEQVNLRDLPSWTSWTSWSWWSSWRGRWPVTANTFDSTDVVTALLNIRRFTREVLVAVPVMVVLLAADGSTRGLSARATQSPQKPEFDLLIRNGHVIDAKNSIDAVRDVAIAGGKVAQVAANIAPNRARDVVDATGFYVTPALIDIHSHVFWGSEPDAAYSNGYSAIQPDDHSFRSGQTTRVDAGGPGWRRSPH